MAINLETGLLGSDSSWSKDEIFAGHKPNWFKFIRASWKDVV